MQLSFRKSLSTFRMMTETVVIELCKSALSNIFTDFLHFPTLPRKTYNIAVLLGHETGL